MLKSTRQGYPNIHRSTWRMNSPKSTKRDFGSWKQQPSLSMAALKKHALSRGICVWKQMRTQWSSWRLQQADFGDPPIGTWADWAVSSWPGLFFVGRGGDDLLPSYVGIIIKTHGSRGISRDPGMNKPGSLWLNHKASFHGFRTPWRQSKATWYSHAVLDHFLNFVSNSQAAKSQREAPSSLKKNSGQISTGSMFFFQGLAKSQLAGSLEKRILT